MVSADAIESRPDSSSLVQVCFLPGLIRHGGRNLGHPAGSGATEAAEVYAG